MTSETMAPRPPVGGPAVLSVTEVAAAELGTWDALTVTPPGGHVYQSRAFAAYRAAFGWRPRFLVTGDGGRVLVLERPWPIVAGASAYVPRGPGPAAGPAAVLAARLAAVSDHLADRGVDVIASDAEVEATSGYAAMLAARGFHRIEEIQPSRHRMDLRLAPGTDERAVFAGMSATHRNLVRNAERQGLLVVRLDRAAGAVDGTADGDPGEGFVAQGPGAADRPEVLVDRLHSLVRAAGERRHFVVGSRPRCGTGRSAPWRPGSWSSSRPALERASRSPRPRSIATANA